MSHSHSQSSSRAGTPSDCVRHENFMNIAAGEQQQPLTSFHAYRYGNHLEPFNLPESVGARSGGGTNKMYEHSPVTQQPLQFPGSGSQSVYHSPSSSPSTPHPQYGDFHPFPLSPPLSEGTSLTSFISQNSQLHQSSVSPSNQPIHLPSPLHQTAFDFSRSSNVGTLPQLYPQRRDAHSHRPDRRHSSASTASPRNFQAGPTFPNYDPLSLSATNPHPSPMYSSMILAEPVRPGYLYMDASRTVEEASGTTEPPPSGIQGGSATNTMGQSHSLTPAPPPAAKTGTRQYRKKTPPVACAVCKSNQTPEWRKGPSGLRTLCNACGLTAAKLSTSEPTSVEEVWHQLSEIGLNRFRGNFVLSPEQKTTAAQNWVTQTANGTHRSTHNPRSGLSSTSLDSSQKPPKISTTSLSATQSKPSRNQQNPSETDAAHQLFAMSQGRNQSLGPPMSIHNHVAPSTTPLELGHHYGPPSSPNPGSLELDERFQHMTCTTADFSGLSAAFTIASSCASNTVNPANYTASPLLSPEGSHHPHVLEMYPSIMDPSENGQVSHGRRNSIGGHRMSISSIINQDPPSRPASSMNQDAHFHRLHQQEAHMHSLLVQNPSTNGYPKQI